MNRRFNYTGRQDIKREHTEIRIVKSDNATPRFTVNLELTKYKLPSEAPVFVEASRHTAWMRWPFGTVGALSAPPLDTLQLTEFGSADNVKFRVKVVEAALAQENGLPARILAHADGIQPILSEEKRDKAESLLPVISLDLNAQEVWRVAFDESDEPMLAIDEKLVLPGERDALIRSPQFVALALPSIFRQILERILLIENFTDCDDRGNWRSDWLCFAASLPGSAAPPSQESGADERQEWIDGAVQAFGARCTVGERFQQFKQEEI